MASSAPSLAELYGDRFRLESCSRFENVIPVYKYKCLRTGITVAFGDVEGPSVSGFFALGMCRPFARAELSRVYTYLYT